MLSQRRSAQLGMFLGGVVLFSSLAVLVAAAKNPYGAVPGQPGLRAADFTLTDTEGDAISLASLRGKFVVLYFSSTRCPVNNDYSDRLAEFSQKYADHKRVEIVAINSAVTPNEQADPYEIRVQSKVCGLAFPTLLDEQSRVAKLFAVETTPTFLIIDPSGVIRYRGAFDDNRSAALVKAHHVEDALTALLAGKDVARPLTASVGCAIK